MTDEEHGLRWTAGVAAKIALGFGMVLALLVGVSLVGLLSLNKTEGVYAEVLKKDVAKVVEAEETLVDAQKIALLARAYAITGDPAQKKKYLGAVVKTEEQLAQLGGSLDRSEERAAYQSLQDSFVDYKQMAQKTVELKDESVKLLAAGQDNRGAEEAIAAWMRQKQDKGSSAFTSAIEEFTEVMQQLVTAGTVDAEQRTVWARNLMAGIAATALFTGMLFAVYLTIIIRRPLVLLEARSREIAAGDLTGENLNVRSRDETSRVASAFNEMQETLRHMLQSIASSSRELDGVARQLNDGARQVSEAADENTATITQVAEGSQETAQTVSEVAESARTTAGHAESGLQVVEQAASQIRVTGETTARISTMVDQLKDASGRISQIVELISAITDQTNLLALNAAIEAARAGDQGRGFAVVAEEVRKLAGQSAQAANEIGGIVHTIGEEVLQVVAAVEKGREESEKSLSAVAQARDIFRDIARHTGDLAAKVENAAAGVQEISSSVENVAAASEEQTATMEELSATADSLGTMAASLRSLTQRYRFEEGETA